MKFLPMKLSKDFTVGLLIPEIGDEYTHFMSLLREKSQNFDWQAHRQFLQQARFRPLYDRAFGQFSRKQMQDCFAPSENIKPEFFAKFHQWILASKLNRVTGLDHFPDRDFISGVTHSLDDLHITHAPRLVCMEKEYAYHRRMKPDFVHRKIETLERGDVLVFAIPFAWYGCEHPQTKEILDRCLALDIPVHVDSAWFGCLRDFNFDFNHPAIQSASFSLSKSLGLGSHRVGVRYSRKRVPGPVSIINDFSMEVTSVMNAGIKMMDHFGADYLQNRYGEAYQLVCEKLNLRPTKAIHIAFDEVEKNVWHPVGIRSFLRYLVDDYNEFK